MKKIIFILLALAACNTDKHKGRFTLIEVPVTGLDSNGVAPQYYQYLLTPGLDSVYWFKPGVDSFKVTMVFQKVSAGYPMPDVINEIDNAYDETTINALKYTPYGFSGDNIINPLGWNFSKDQVFNVAHHKNTLAFLQVDGWVDFTFTGYKVEYYAEQFESYGIAGVSVDKGPEVMVDLWAPTNGNNSRVVFTADSLENNASHTVRVRYTHQRNPNSNNANARINLDKFVTYFRQGTYYVPSSPAPATQQYEQR